MDGGWSLSNLLQPTSLALIAAYLVVLFLVVGLHVSFRGSVVV